MIEEVFFLGYRVILVMHGKEKLNEVSICMCPTQV